jgi:hypothetical protein
MNINPNPYYDCGLGTQTSVWASGYFNQGFISNSIELNNSFIKSPSSTNLTFEHPSINLNNPYSIGLVSDLPSQLSNLNNDASFVGSDNITGILKLTQSDYDSLSSVDDQTLYLIID